MEKRGVIMHRNPGRMKSATLGEMPCELGRMTQGETTRHFPRMYSAHAAYIDAAGANADAMQSAMITT